VFKPRADRDRDNAKVIADPRFMIETEDMPFDGKRIDLRGP